MSANLVTYYIDMYIIPLKLFQFYFYKSVRVNK